MVALPTPSILAIRFTEVLAAKRLLISSLRALTSAVRTLWGVRGPGLSGSYRPLFSSILRITPLSQPKDVAISERVLPDFRFSMISSMLPSRLFPIRGVLGFVTETLRGWLPFQRPLRTLSVMLSWGVPRNRWLGFVHSGLSQWWQTSKPSGMGPLCSSHENRCAGSWLVSPLGENRPYPFLSFLADHVQQVSVLVTLSQNLSSTPFTENDLWSCNAPHYNTSLGG